jgi:competence transcription factor ComK
MITYFSNLEPIPQAKINLSLSLSSILAATIFLYYALQKIIRFISLFPPRIPVTYPKLNSTISTMFETCLKLDSSLHLKFSFLFAINFFR